MKKLFFTIAVFLLCLQVTWSNGSIEVYLSMNKEKYYSGEDVLLKIHVRNNSAKTVTFTIYDISDKVSQSFTTFQPVVYSIRGKVAENIVPHVIEGVNLDELSSKLVKRRIKLGPLEEMIRQIPLNRVYDLKKNTLYRVKGYFFPDYAAKKVITSSNRVEFFVVGQAIRSKIISQNNDKTLGPDEIILLALHAEKNRKWEKMIKYIDIAEYINSFSRFVRKYNLANRYEKRIIENDFITYLSRERFDYIVDFIIKRVKITGKKAIVEAHVQRFGLRRNTWYMYRFRLEKKTKINWLIEGYEATVIRGK